MLKYAKTETTMVDSGGYQIIGAEKNNKKVTFDPSLPLMRSANRLNISPSHVVEAACKLQPSIMTALDFPIRVFSDKTDQDREFLRKLKFNIVWTQQTALLREKHCPHIQLFIPVQCYNLDQFETFWNSIKGIQCDGLSLPIRNLKLPELALFLLLFYQIGARKVHILGASSFFMIALAAFFARHFFEWVSFDSTSWRQAAQFQKYRNPYDLSPEYIGSEVLIDEQTPIMCQCSFCAKMTFTLIKNLPYTEKVDFLRNHNFYATERVTEEMFEQASTLPNLKRFLRRHSKRNKEIDELISCLARIDLLRDKDIKVLKPIFKVAA
jgi:queuine/archaeosine tRNA-ribosyltransferase